MKQFNKFANDLTHKFNLWKKNKSTPIQTARDIQSEYDKKKHAEYAEREPMFEAYKKEQETLLKTIEDNNKQLAELKSRDEKPISKSVFDLSKYTNKIDARAALKLISEHGTGMNCDQYTEALQSITYSDLPEWPPKTAKAKSRFIIEDTNTKPRITDEQAARFAKSLNMNYVVESTTSQISKTPCFKFNRHNYCLMFENGKAYYQTDRMAEATILVKNGPGSPSIVMNSSNNVKPVHLTNSDFDALVKGNVDAETIFKSYSQLKSDTKVKLNTNSAQAVW